MTNLYINNEHCLDVRQLKQYFQDLEEDSDIYLDLLDYSRHGDLVNWLNEHNEVKLANEVLSIDSALGDADYMNKLAEIVAASENYVSSFKKPSFEKCVSLTISNKVVGYDTFYVEVSFKIMLAVNENYEIKLKTGWGTKGFTLKPADFEELKTYQTSYIFHKRAGNNIDNLSIFVDNSLSVVESIPKVNIEKLTPQLPNVAKEDATAKYSMASLIYQIDSILPCLILGLKYRLEEKEQLKK